METNRIAKKCSCCGKMIEVNQGIHVGYMGSDDLPYCLYSFNCECGGTLSEKRHKAEWIIDEAKKKELTRANSL